MKYELYYETTSRLLAAHGLHDWHVTSDKAIHRLGYAHSGKKIISLSIYHLQNSDDSEIIDTIRHEVAHAIVGTRNKHNSLWKMKAIEIGARPKACGPAVKNIETIVKPKYSGICAKCGKAFYAYRRLKGMQNRIHAVCGKEGIVAFSPCY